MDSFDNADSCTLPSRLFPSSVIFNPPIPALAPTITAPVTGQDSILPTVVVNPSEIPFIEAVPAIAPTPTPVSLQDSVLPYSVVKLKPINIVATKAVKKVNGAKIVPRAPRTLQKSTHFKEVIPICRPCDHSCPASFVSLDIRTYFLEAYYLKHDGKAPKQCIACDKRFGVDYKVNSSNPVHMCPNAQNTTHNCLHALCKSCFYLFQFDAIDGNKRKRRDTFAI